MTFHGFTDSAAVDCARTAMIWMRDARNSTYPGYTKICVEHARTFWKNARNWQNSSAASYAKLVEQRRTKSRRMAEG